MFLMCVLSFNPDWAIMSLPKPMMRGLLAKRLRIHLPVAFGLSIFAAIAFKVTEWTTTCQGAFTWMMNLFGVHLQTQTLGIILFSQQYTVSEPRKRAYADFYKQYDCIEDFNAMKEAGIFESVRPSSEWNQWVFSQKRLQRRCHEHPDI